MLLLTVAFITFFTVYAFRYDVLDSLYKKRLCRIRNQGKYGKEAKACYREKYIYPENINDVTNKLNELFPDYDYHIWSTIYGAKKESSGI